MEIGEEDGGMHTYQIKEKDGKITKEYKSSIVWLDEIIGVPKVSLYGDILVYQDVDEEGVNIVLYYPESREINGKQVWKLMEKFVNSGGVDDLFTLPADFGTSNSQSGAVNK